ncbi:MAG TPA: hypothetical protein VGI96_44570 [Streptosporangiaceae bacterium]
MGGGAVLTACAPVLVRGGTDEAAGEVLLAGTVAEQVSWCAGLAREMTARLVEEHWNPADVRALASGRDAAGQALPKQAWMALRCLGWSVSAPDGVYVNDRVARMAQEQAGRLLRSAAWRDTRRESSPRGRKTRRSAPPLNGTPSAPRSRAGSTCRRR